MLKYETQFELSAQTMDLVCVEGGGPSVQIEVNLGRIYSEKLPNFIGFEVLSRKDTWIDVEVEQMSMLTIIHLLAHLNDLAPFQIEVRSPVHGCVQVDGWYKLAA